MNMNPLIMMQLKSSWDRFVKNHPKFPLFWKAVRQNGLSEGTVVEFKVTTPEGKELCSNLKLTQDDMELMEQLKKLMNSAS